MNKKVLIIGRAFHPDGKETATQIYDGLKSEGTLNPDNVDLLFLKDILFDISDSGVKVYDANLRELNQYGAVLMTNWFSHASIRKDIALSLALYFQANDITFFNTESLQSRSTSKLSQMVKAAYNGVNVPRTIFSLDYQKMMQYADELTWPCIVKDAQASRGKGNYLFESSKDAMQVAKDHTEKHPFMVQEQIDSDGSDYRFFVAGSKIRLVIKRSGNGDSHVTNTSAGASTALVEVSEFPKEVINAVTQASGILHREVTGIDIMFDKNTKKYYFLEANPIPQIATGSNVELKLRALAEALKEAAEK